MMGRKRRVLPFMQQPTRQVRVPQGQNFMAQRAVLARQTAKPQTIRMPIPQARARAISRQASRGRLPKYTPRFWPEIGAESLQAQMRIIRRYAGAAQETLRKLKNFTYDTNTLWRASEMAARLRIPKERLAEAIMQNGLENTYKALQEIRKMSLAMKIKNEEISRQIAQRGIMPIYQSLAEQYQQAQQMGMVA
jgi:hypothetical protein